MFRRVKIFRFLIEFIVISSMFKFCTAQFVEENKILVDGNVNTLKEIFANLQELRETINDLKMSNEQYSNSTDTDARPLPIFDIRYDALPKKCVTEMLPKNCAEATACTRRSGIYEILVTQHSHEPFYVECDAETEGGDWIVIQRRQDGSVDFYRYWEDYEKGFGDVDGEHFIGLKKLYALTNFHGPQELLIVMEPEYNTRAFAKFSGFSIGDKTEMYKLKKLGMFSGTAGNSLIRHLGMKFSTKDRDNDIYSGNCADENKGAWWYADCRDSNLNGKYGGNIEWYPYRDYKKSLKYVKMMIRRRRINS